MSHLVITYISKSRENASGGGGSNGDSSRGGDDEQMNF